MLRIRSLIIATTLLVFANGALQNYRSSVLEPEFLADGQTVVHVEQIPVPDPQTAAVIRGQTINARTGTAVDGAQVLVYPVGCCQLAGYALSDKTGRYEIRVAPGLYSVSATREGFVSTSYSDVSDLNNLTLSARQEAAVDFRMTPGAVIAGKVTDIDGAPIANADVQAGTKIYRQGKIELMGPGANARTNERGEYQLINLPAGRYYLQAGKSGNASQTGRVFLPMIYSQPVRMGIAGHRGAIDFQLRDDGRHSVSGQVTFLDSGQPLVKMAIRVDPEGFGMHTTGQTDADGTFRLEGMTAGKYRMEGRLIGADDGRRSSPGGYFLRFFELRSADIRNLVIHVGRGNTVEGNVSALGAELPQKMKAMLLYRNPTGGSRYAIGGTIAANGSLQIRGVQPGIYDLEIQNDPASATHPREFFVNGITVGGVDVSVSGIQVPEGATPVRVSVTIDFRPGSISGKTVDFENKPIAHANVVLMSADPEKRSLSPYWKETRSDRDGAFRLGSLVPGAYLLFVRPGDGPESELSPEAFAILEKHAVPVTVVRSGVVNQDLQLTKQVRQALLALSP